MASPPRERKEPQPDLRLIVGVQRLGATGFGPVEEVRKVKGFKRSELAQALALRDQILSQFKAAPAPAPEKGPA